LTIFHDVFAAKGVVDTSSVPRGSEDAAEAVQGAERPHHGHHAQGWGEVSHQEAQGRADEKTGHPRRAVRAEHRRDASTTEC